MALRLKVQSQYHVVTRPFEADGHELFRGEVVDTTTWNQGNIQPLINVRRLETAPWNLQSIVAVCKDCSRAFISQEFLDQHACTERMANVG